MKALVRKIDSANGYLTTYKWITVDLEELAKYSHYKDKDTNEAYGHLDVLNVKNDCRRKYVVCNQCGKVIKNTPEAFEKHCNIRELKADCLSCSKSMKEYLSNELTEKMKLNEDGTYKIITSRNANLRCRNSYARPKVDEAKTIDGCCVFYSCRRKGFREFDEDFFSKYKNPFEFISTEKALVDQGWKLYQINLTNRIYKYKSRNLFVAVDKNGLIEYFYYEIRRNSYEFVYSSKYDEFFGYGGIISSNPFTFYDTSKKYEDKIKELVRELYK